MFLGTVGARCLHTRGRVGSLGWCAWDSECSLNAMNADRRPELEVRVDGRIYELTVSMLILNATESE